MIEGHGSFKTESFHIIERLGPFKAALFLIAFAFMTVLTAVYNGGILFIILQFVTKFECVFYVKHLEDHVWLRDYLFNSAVWSLLQFPLTAYKMIHAIFYAFRIVGKNVIKILEMIRMSNNIIFVK